MKVNLVPGSVKIKSRGARAVLRSDGVRADAARRARAVAAQASDGDATFYSDSSVGKNRARATAYTGNAEAMLAEAEERALTRALDAGR